MYRIATGVFAFLSMTGFAFGQISDDLSAVEGGQDLDKVKRAKFRETYANAEIDFSRYNRIYLGDAFFDYRDVGPAERSRSNSFRHSSKSYFGISQADRDKFEQVVDEAFLKELGKGKKFEIVDEIDDRTLIMRGAVVDIVSNVPPEFVGRSEVYLATVGEATLMLEFIDGPSGIVVARVSERRRIEQPGGRIDTFTMPANSATVWAEVRRWASNAARRLRGTLDGSLGG